MTLFYRRLPRFDYLSPTSLDEALSVLRPERGKDRLLAGGTDLIIRLKQREIDPPERIVDLKGIPGLDSITYDPQHGLRMGPLATIAAIERSGDVRTHYPVLSQAASVMASPQVRNKGTFGGNICNAVPSADSAPALLVVGAAVRIKGAGTERVVPLDSFFTGPRETVLAPDEIVVEIAIPVLPADRKGVYLKLSPRHSMDLAVVGVAVEGTCEDGVCTHVRIALGAVAPTPVRSPMAESTLLGRKITAGLIDEAARCALTQCSPIDDHRASAEYRCDMVYAMTRRALNQVFLNERI